MTHRIILFACLMTLSPLCAMQQAELKPWVAQASSVTVELMKKISESYPIDNTTTILDLKNRLQTSEGFPADRQTIRAMWPKPWTAGFVKEYSISLQDHELVKAAMNRYNTSAFKLNLNIRPIRKFPMMHFEQSLGEKAQPADEKE